MANQGRNRPFGAFNPFANDRLNRNPPIQPQPEQAPTYGPNPFNRANRPTRPAGINPPFVFNQEPREPRWDLRRDGQWGLNINPQRPNRVTAYNADQEYVRFQAHALGLPQAPPQGPGVAPPPVNDAVPPPPPQPAQPAQPVPQGPGLAPPPAPPAQPAPEGDAQPGQNQGPPPVIPLGRHGNAGTGRELSVPPLIAIHNLGRDLLGYMRTVVAAIAGSIGAVTVAVIEVGGPLLHFATRWAIFLFFAAFAIWASIPTVLRVLVAVHKTVAVLLAALLELLAWALDVRIKWPRSALVSYTLRPEYTSRAVTGMAFLEPGVCPVGGSIRGPPYGATALSSADITMFTLPFPLSLPQVSTVCTILWSLLVAVVSTAIWALGAALAIDLHIFPAEDEGDRDE